MKMDLNLSGSQLMGSRVVVPTGNYSLEIVGVDTVQSKAGGWMIVVDSKILAGDKAGVVLKRHINFVNTNADSQRMGLAEIKTIMTMGKHPTPDLLNDSNELLGLKMNAYLEEKPSSFVNKEGKTIQTTENDFKSYSELSTVVAGLKEAPLAPPVTNTNFPPAAAAAQEQAITQAAPAATKQFPWQ